MSFPMSHGAQLLDEKMRQVYHPIPAVDAVLTELLSQLYFLLDGKIFERGGVSGRLRGG